MSNLLELKDEDPNTPIETDRAELEQRLKSGANWFYWVAGLSLINSVLFFFGAEVSFLGGLGFSLVVDGVVSSVIESGGPVFLRFFAISINLVLFAAFAFFGFYAGKQVRAAFILGIALYLLDSLIVLVLDDFLMAGFHVFALFFIIRGYLACRSIHKVHQASI